MSGDNILLDTNIILYLFNGDTNILPLIEDRNLLVSFITELELLSFKKLSKLEKTSIKKFLSYCTIIDINSNIKEKVIQLRKQYGLKLPDAIIAGTALTYDFSLVTADKDFSKIKEIDIVLYESL